MQPSRVISLDAPIGGWDAFNSLDNMPPDNAVILDNLIPGAGTVDTRRGTIEYGDTGTGLPVETVASLETDSDSRLVVASNGGVWDMTNSQPGVGAKVTEELAPPGTYSNDRWQTQNFRKLDEEGVLIMANGEDEVQLYESPYTGLAPAVFTKDDGNEGQEPIPGDFIGVLSFKGRCYYWYDNDDSFWYAQAGSYQGEMQEFNLGVIAKKGGKIVLITSWTQQDSGDGKDDFIVFVMSTGEVIVYQGDDPQTVGFWELVGKYTTAEPLSIRGVSQYGSDTILMTKDGYIALSTLVQQGRISDVPAFSRMISGAITQRTQTNAIQYGWDCVLFAKQGLFLFNVPLSDQTFEQHVMNTVTNRWCRFKDINVICLAEHNERLFGGTHDGRVLGILESSSDEGEPITFTGLPAFNYLDDPGNHKFISAAQVLTTHPNPELIELTGYADFNFPNLPPLTTPVAQVPGLWSVYPDGYPPWVPPLPAEPTQSDEGSYWDEEYWSISDSPFTTKGWQNVSAFGYAVSVLVRFNKVNEGVSWRSTGIRFNNAGAQ
jgi:hypothetical protein